jgi:hypothetical protein
MNRFAGNCVLAVVFACMALCAVCAVSVDQGLPKGRIRILGSLVSTPPEAVTLTARLPRGYGLTASEARDGWEALNPDHVVETVMEGPSFELDFPPVRYCVTKVVWRPWPPPPAAFILRFSDAPGEEYWVWGAGTKLEYVVLGANRVPMRKEDARWWLRLREYGPARDDQRLGVFRMDLGHESPHDGADRPRRHAARSRVGVSEGV